MQREIKFRAWDKENKEMLPDVCTNTDDFTDMLNETFRYWQDAEIGTLELMQYTGLKDKNGKEIYEGDIVKTDKLESVHYDIPPDHIGVAEFDVQRGRYMIGDWLLDDVKVSQSEVIGDIYQNPELLNSSRE